ncbi:MAG: ATP-binding protein, partial [Oceanidesulfovibrio sp.]
PLDVSARRITFDNKPALLCIGRDITQRRRVESMLLKAKETAESNVRMQNEFVANISHELRTPLSSIIGITELLTLTELDDSQRENLRRIAFSAGMLLSLINDLLDLSRLESGRFAMASKPFSLLELMREIKNIFLEKVAAKNLSFSYNVAEDIPEYLRGDPIRIKQVLINIVGNAIKFTAEGAVLVQLTRAEAPEPEYARNAAPDDSQAEDETVDIQFRVSDTGIGMSKEDVERIFQRFTQGDNTSGRAYGGAGLGLSISRQLIRHMGGDIRVESAANQGSTFIFSVRLPVAPEPAPQESGAFRHDRIAPLRVLLAEDNEINRDMIKAMFQVDGHEVRTASDGLEVLDTLEDFQPDVIFMDLQMPRCDGYEAARMIRRHANPGLAAIPIIALSAHVQKSTNDDWRTTGMDGYLSKPIQLDTVRGALASVAGGKSLPGSCEQDAAEDQKEPAMLDLDTLRKNMGHRDELVRLACEKFLSHAMRYISDLESAIGRRDSKDTRRLAHSFKSVTGTIGAERARLEALAIEKEAPTEKWEILEKRLARLDGLVRELQTLVASAPELAALPTPNSHQPE